MINTGFDSHYAGILRDQVWLDMEYQGKPAKAVDISLLDMKKSGDLTRALNETKLEWKPDFGNRFIVTDVEKLDGILEAVAQHDSRHHIQYEGADVADRLKAAAKEGRTTSDVIVIPGMNM